MRFRIRARNPKTQQAHQFEVEGDSPGDARDKVEEAGLVASSVEPAPSPDPPDPGAAPRGRPLRRIVPRRIAPRLKRRTINVVLLLGIMAAGAATVPIMLSGGATTFAPLDATIRFDGFQFKIINQDDFTWHNVRLDVNGGLTHSGYLHRPGTLTAGQSYTASVTAFINEEGQRFSPVTNTPRQMTITCKLDDGQTARYTKRWN